MTKHVSMYVISLLFLFSVSNAFANKIVSSETIVIGSWGSQPGDFGFVSDANYPFNHSLQLFINDDNIFILDGINNRVQVFAKNGELQKVVNLQTDWRKDGLPFEFSVLNDEYYVLQGFIEGEGGKIINKYSSKGLSVASFGKLKTKKADEGYIRLLANKNKNYLITNIWPNKIVAYDSKGKIIESLYNGGINEITYVIGMTYDKNPIIYSFNSKSRKDELIVLDLNKSNSKKRSTRAIGYNMYDKGGHFYSVKLIKNKRKGKSSLPPQMVLNSLNEESGEEYKILINDVIEHTLNNQKIILPLECRGECNSSMMDSDGSIYQLLPLKDGVVVRRYLIKDDFGGATR